MTQQTPSGEPFEGGSGAPSPSPRRGGRRRSLKAGAPNVVHGGAGRHRLRPPRLLRLDHRDAEHRRAGGRRRCATPASTPPRSARRPAPACSPAATTTRSACGRSPTWTPAFPTCAARMPTSAATLAEILREQRLCHLRRRQVAPGADGRVHGRRPVRQLAAAEGLRPLLRLPAGRDRPVPPRADLRQPLRRSAGDGRRGLSRLGGHRGPLDRPWCAT